MWVCVSVCGRCASPPGCPLCPVTEGGEDVRGVLLGRWPPDISVNVKSYRKNSPWSWCWTREGSYEPPGGCTSHSDTAAPVCPRSPGWTAGYSSPAGTQITEQVEVQSWLFKLYSLSTLSTLLHFSESLQTYIPKTWKSSTTGNLKGAVLLPAEKWEHLYHHVLYHVWGNYLSSKNKLLTHWRP